MSEGQRQTGGKGALEVQHEQSTMMLIYNKVRKNPLLGIEGSPVFKSTGGSCRESGVLFPATTLCRIAIYNSRDLMSLSGLLGHCTHMVQAKQLIWKNKNKEITFKRKKPIILHAYLKKKSKQKQKRIQPLPQ